MVEDYVQSHLAGNHVFSRGKGGHKQTLSCFDKTLPVDQTKRAGGHGPPRVISLPCALSFLYGRVARRMNMIAIRFKGVPPIL